MKSSSWKRVRTGGSVWKIRLRTRRMASARGSLVSVTCRSRWSRRRRRQRSRVCRWKFEFARTLGHSIVFPRLVQHFGVLRNLLADGLNVVELFDEVGAFDQLLVQVWRLVPVNWSGLGTSVWRMILSRHVLTFTKCTNSVNFSVTLVHCHRCFHEKAKELLGTTYLIKLHLSGCNRSTLF